MTAKQIYEGVMVEINKTGAPSLILEDFVYFLNKVILQFVNKRYNIYDVSQQTTDDLRVLKSTAILKPEKSTDRYGFKDGDAMIQSPLHGATYEVDLPHDYLHLLNCVCNYQVKRTFKCYDKDTYVPFAATRLTADAWSHIINNFYMRPSYKKPYYYIHNVNTQQQPTLSTNPYDAETNKGTDAQIGTIKTAYEKYAKTLQSESLNYTIGKDSNGYYTASDATSVSYIIYNKATGKFSLRDANFVKESIDNGTLTVFGLDDNLIVNNDALIINTNDFNAFSKASTYIIVNDNFFNVCGDKAVGTGFQRTMTVDEDTIDLVEKQAVYRYGNPSNVRMEIRYGKDYSIFELKSVYVDYIKAPQYVRLTQEQLDLDEDTSQIMEFPDYVCQEIIIALTQAIMENSSDARLQTHVPLNISIANPAQQVQAQQQA